VWWSGVVWVGMVGLSGKATSSLSDS
jgi:hypothetical protein